MHTQELVRSDFNYSLGFENTNCGCVDNAGGANCGDFLQGPCPDGSARPFSDNGADVPCGYVSGTTNTPLLRLANYRAVGATGKCGSMPTTTSMGAMGASSTSYFPHCLPYYDAALLDVYRLRACGWRSELRLSAILGSLPPVLHPVYPKPSGHNGVVPVPTLEVSLLRVEVAWAGTRFNLQTTTATAPAVQ